jgi:tetratricopeptide (TPR) repeat protein
MLALGKGAPPKLEARSQRMMGLSALALDRHAEAADYLTNAQELSESAGDEYERMMAAYTKAIVEFLSGALVKSLKALNCAEESAARLFRMDIRAAIDALRGRIDLELGSYDEAARRFTSLAELANQYSIPGAEQRAGIWRARAMSYAGEFDNAALLLEENSADAEARVFRGELEILRGRPRDARTWLDTPENPLLHSFDPPDSISWDSLFSEFEGRCIGFDAANTPLAVFRTALALFAQGLDERNPACAVSLHALTRSEHGSKNDPGMGTYSFFCYLLEERLQEPPVDKQTVLSRSFKILQQRAGRIENRAQRALYMEKNAWNKRLIEAARTHKFI